MGTPVAISIAAQSGAWPGRFNSNPALSQMIYLPAEFPHEADLCYLNHAAVAPWPKRTAEAVQRFAFENMTCGAEKYPQWMAVESELRERLRWLLNAPSADDIALVKNTSEGLSFVAAGLNWSPGDQVIGIADDFPSNRVVWEALDSQGVEFIQVDTNASGDPESALLARITDRTRLMAISSVHFATGIRLDLKRLSVACKAKDILLCVDAIQSLGAVRFDLQETPADFVVADGHKWMLGPEGLGVFYVNPQLRESLQLTQFGWAMRKSPGNYSPVPWEAARSAKRFEPGSPNMLGIHALHASIGLLQEVGFDLIERSLRKNIAFLRERLSMVRGMALRTPEDPGRSAGILSLHVESADPDRLWRELMDERIICASRGGFLRLSPHFYTRQQALEKAVDSIQRVILNIEKSS